VFAGAVLADGRVGGGLPSATWFLAAASGAVLLALLGRRARLRSIPLLVATAPAAGVATSMYVSDEVVHFLGVTSDLGILLATAHIALVVYAQRPPLAHRFLLTGALGGLIGAGCASLAGLVVADGNAVSWVPGLGWAGGMVAGCVLGRRSPRETAVAPRSVSLAVWPLFGAWIMAVIASFPAAPRHELTTSAGAQVLGGLLAILLAAVSVGLLRAERRTSDASVLQIAKLAASMNIQVVVPLSLLLIGALQAASYSAVTMDDLIHFWSVGGFRSLGGHLSVLEQSDRSSRLPDDACAVVWAIGSYLSGRAGPTLRRESVPSSCDLRSVSGV